MNYQSIYNQIISKGQLRGLDKSKLEGYYEKHHIIPRCMNGVDDDNNMVLLTAREHFICHKLLWKIYPDNNKLFWAVYRMVFGKTKIYYKITGREYQKFRDHSNIIRRNTITITNGFRNKSIKKLDHIPDGWFKGTTFRKCISITDGITNKRITKYDIIPDGWYLGSCVRHKWINNGIIRKHIKHDSEVPHGWVLGSLQKTTKDKIRITDGINNTFINNDDVIPNGWYKGFTNPKSRKGMITITNGKNNKYLNVDDVIPDGWYKGRTKKTPNKYKPRKTNLNQNINNNNMI